MSIVSLEEDLDVDSSEEMVAYEAILQEIASDSKEIVRFQRQIAMHHTKLKKMIKTREMKVNMCRLFKLYPEPF
jgi:hypothetical protein